MSKKLQGKTGKAGATQELTAQSSANQGKNYNFYKYKWYFADENGKVGNSWYERGLADNPGEAAAEAQRIFEEHYKTHEYVPSVMRVYEFGKKTWTDKNGLHQHRRCLAEYSKGVKPSPSLSMYDKD